DRAAETQQSGATMVMPKPRRVQPVVLRRRPEVPDIGISVAGEQAIPGELVACPFADDGAGRVADIVLVEAEERAQAGIRECGTRARETIVVQPAKIDPLLEIDLCMAGRLQWPVPTVM